MSGSRPQPAMDAGDAGAFEGEWNAIEDSSCFCSGCFCSNTMCGQPCPTCFGQGKFCCAEVGYATVEPCGEKGFLFGVSKLCCCVLGVSTSNCAIGCCDVFCCGRPYGEGQMVEDSELAFMEGVHWCCYACVGGWGCLSPSPCIAADIKVCCVESKASTIACCDDGACVALRLKTCCCIHQFQCPPSTSLGLGCCCVACIKRERSFPARSPALMTAAPSQEEMK